MKKYVTKLLSLLMALCMVGALCVPSALAAENSDEADLPEFNESLQMFDETASPRLTVINGMRIGVQYVAVYPAYYTESTGQYGYSPYVYDINVYPAADQQTGFCTLSTAQTTALLTEFKEKTGVEANAWVLVAMYSLYADGKGSYGKYFQFTTSGNCIQGTTIRQDVSKSDTTCAIGAAFRMPENTSGKYSINLNGGFYYYSAYAKKELSSLAQLGVYFNAS